MKRNGRILRALVCALVVAGNGAGVLGQEQHWKMPAPPPGEPIENARIMIDPMPMGGVMQQEGGVVVGAPGEYSFTFVSSEMAFDSKVIKGAPFSADAVTETVQVLGDGNRITRTMTSKLYRDAEGRTRREQTLSGIGAWATTEDAPPTIFINDPVTGTNYVLNTATRTAQKAMQFFFKREESVASGDKGGEKNVNTFTYRTDSSKPEIRGGVLNGKALKKVQPAYPAVARAAGAQGSVTVEVTVDEQGNVVAARAVSGHQLLQPAAVEAARQWSFSPTLLEGKPVKVAGTITFEFALSGRDGEATQGGVVSLPHASNPLPPPGGAMAMMRATVPVGAKEPSYPVSNESLGKQSFEGVEAEGKRTTVTIPAGTIGNERAIQIVQESWYSSELQTAVMTKHSDPRFGETTYRLTNISRSEPDHSLFEVPAGYKINEGLPRSEQRWVIERKLQGEPKDKP
jgi:TonB family protein